MKNGIIIPLSEKEVKELICSCVRTELEKVQLQSSGEDEILKTHELCKLLQISKPTVYSYVEKGIINAYFIGTRRYYLKSEIVAKLKEGKFK